eukprot:SAG31_NODE_1165_length_9578_cov_5.386011_8_plen_49_part_00
MYSYRVLLYGPLHQAIDVIGLRQLSLAPIYTDVLFFVVLYAHGEYGWP